MDEITNKTTEKTFRKDSIELNTTYYTDEGYLIDMPVVSKTGVFVYRDDSGGIRRELRCPDEVFSADSLMSFTGKPVILTHDAGVVTSENIRDEFIGTMLSEGIREGDAVRARIVIHDTGRLNENDYRQLSLGYTLELDMTPGEYNGEPYDAVQRRIVVNHLALVANARLGAELRLNIDSQDEDAAETPSTETPFVQQAQLERISRRDTSRLDGMDDNSETAYRRMVKEVYRL
jgi:hypothetical protein